MKQEDKILRVARQHNAKMCKAMQSGLNKPKQNCIQDLIRDKDRLKKY